jgi:hypothetical protein
MTCFVTTKMISMARMQMICGYYSDFATRSASGGSSYVSSQREAANPLQLTR